MKSPVPLLLVLGACLIAGCANDSNPRTGADALPDTALARKLNDQAFALIRQDKHAEAEPLLKRSIDADVTFGAARNNLGLVYFHQGQLYPAAWEFQNAIRLMPYQPEPRNNLGLVLERAGKLTEAAEAYEKARKMEPDNPEFLGNLARVKLNKGDHDEETKKLLQELSYKDPRPAWRNWAREKLALWYSKPNPAP